MNVAVEAGSSASEWDVWGDFSPRQHQIALMIGKCYQNKAIATKLGCSEKTVRNHITVIYRKLSRSVLDRNLHARVALALLVRGYRP